MTPLRIILFAFGSAGLSLADSYRFSLDGREFDAKVLPVTGERLGKPNPGDLGFVGGIPFVLQKPGHYRFRSDGPSRYYLRIDDSVEVPAAVRVGMGDESSGRPADPLSALAAAEMATLIGIDLVAPAARWQDALSDVGWSQTALRIETGPEFATLPVLPSGVRHLSIEVSPSSSLRSLQALASLQELRFLDLHLDQQTEVSLKVLSGLPHLRNLSIRGGVVTENDQAEFKSLRFLKLRELAGLDSIGFVSRSPSLRVFKIDHTAVSDLSPLAGLSQLRLLSANGTKVDALPPLESLPALRDLRLHSTPVAENDDLIEPLRPKLNVLVKNWEPSIRAFETQDKKLALPQNPILFIGSSSIRRWNLEQSFPGLLTLNRGFGGSELSDALRYFDRIVLPHRPRVIVLYAGENDISNGETPEQVAADYGAFAAKVRSKLPETNFAFLSIKPSPKHREKWPLVSEANKAIREFAESDPHLHYLDIATPMLGPESEPIPELFLEDNLHLTAAGYELWSQIVMDLLNRLPTTRSE